MWGFIDRSSHTYGIFIDFSSFKTNSTLALQINKFFYFFIINNMMILASENHKKEAHDDWCLNNKQQKIYEMENVHAHRNINIELRVLHIFCKLRSNILNQTKNSLFSSYNFSCFYCLSCDDFNVYETENFKAAVCIVVTIYKQYREW